MVMIANNETTTSLDVFDEAGRPLGRIRLPTCRQVAGPRAGTVLLQRYVPMPPTRAGNRRMR